MNDINPELGEVLDELTRTMRSLGQHATLTQADQQKLLLIQNLLLRSKARKCLPDHDFLVTASRSFVDELNTTVVVRIHCQFDSPCLRLNSSEEFLSPRGSAGVTNSDVEILAGGKVCCDGTLDSNLDIFARDRDQLEKKIAPDCGIVASEILINITVA